MVVYFEGLSRSIATRGMIFLTFTPLKGISDVVHSFISECHPHFLKEH